MEENLKEKTGRTLPEWKALLAATGLEKHGDIMKLLKGEHGISHGFANFITLKFREADAASFSEDDLLASQYKGKEGLRPIYDALSAMITALGADIEVAPKKAAVSFRRKRQFALVQPSTKTRIDLGLKFNDRAPEGRLGPSGPFGTMCSHRVQLTDVTEVDAELQALLKAAYDEAG
ncbi:MAG: DUF4287 domain-containing protein [Alphaproteobacteria bacterium]|nr:MAG: DUF4287 domain-containing protein [Alphaproteobacteria bacterium]